jgi:hypothetical protein
MKKIKRTETAASSARAHDRAAERRRTWDLMAFDNIDAMKREEYAYWQSQPGYVRLAAISEMTTEQYAMKGQRVPRLQRTLVHLEQA